MDINQQKINKKLNLQIGASLFVLIALIGGFTYAFFNYTRTGEVNTLRLGNITFETSQDGNINLTNAFPIASSTIDNTPIDEDNIGVVSVDISGSTSYSGGIEYVVTVDNFNNTTLNNKKIPVSIATSVEGRNSKSLGTSTSAYFDENVRENSNVAIYRKTDYTNVFEDEQLLVGYIPKDIEVDGTLIIKAYLDKDVIAISDTYDGTESNNMGTTNTWINGRTYFTTEEWNNLQGTPISFNVKVEANEGIWVEEVRTVNVMNTFPTVITDEKTNIKEVYFNKMSASAMQTAYDNATIKTDLTYNDEGKVLAWFEENTEDNTKYNLIVASDGDTYLTSGQSMFEYWQNLTKITFGNINTSRVTDMYRMFCMDQNLEEIVGLNKFNTSNVINMSYLFYYDSKLTEIDLSSFSTSSLQQYNVGVMFAFNSTLTKIYVSQLWDVSNFNPGPIVFTNCPLLVGGNGTTFNESEDRINMAIIDGANGQPGYLTDIADKPTN